MSKYEQQEVILAHRNSFSHTDKDATCLRMKDDRLLSYGSHSRRRRKKKSVLIRGIRGIRVAILPL